MIRLDAGAPGFPAAFTQLVNARREADAQLARARVNRPFADTVDDEDDEEGCFICHL